MTRQRQREEEERTPREDASEPDADEASGSTGRGGRERGEMGVLVQRVQRLEHTECSPDLYRITEGRARTVGFQGPRSRAAYGSQEASLRLAIGSRQAGACSIVLDSCVNKPRPGRSSGRPQQKCCTALTAAVSVGAVVKRVTAAESRCHSTDCCRQI